MPERPPFRNSTDRQPSTEELLAEQSVVLERKTFVISLRANGRGRFLRITECFHGGRDNIMVPEAGFEEFTRVLNLMVQAMFETPME